MSQRMGDQVDQRDIVGLPDTEKAPFGVSNNK